VAAESVLETLRTEAFAVGGGPCARGGRGSTGRVGAEEEVHLLAVPSQALDQLVQEAALADARFALDQDDLPLPGTGSLKTVA